MTAAGMVKASPIKVEVEQRARKVRRVTGLHRSGGCRQTFGGRSLCSLIGMH